MREYRSASENNKKEMLTEYIRKIQQIYLIFVIRHTGVDIIQLNLLKSFIVLKISLASYLTEMAYFGILWPPKLLIKLTEKIYRKL